MIPPKIFTKIPLTLSSPKMILNASVTFSLVAPPPTSRKLAGFPPKWLIVSIVAIAKPAPFTIQPMSPSKAMYDKSYLEASISFGSSSSKSRNSWISLCLNIALSSKLTLASNAKTSPSPVVTSGLISTIEQSFSTKTLYKEIKNFAALLIDSLGILILKAILLA